MNSFLSLIDSLSSSWTRARLSLAQKQAYDRWELSRLIPLPGISLHSHDRMVTSPAGVVLARLCNHLKEMIGLTIRATVSQRTTQPYDQVLRRMRSLNNAQPPSSVPPQRPHPQCTLASVPSSQRLGEPQPLYNRLSSPTGKISSTAVTLAAMRRLIRTA